MLCKHYKPDRAATRPLKSLGALLCHVLAKVSMGTAPVFTKIEIAVLSVLCLKNH